MKRNQGFTLIELLITIVIIAILMAIGMVVYGNVQRQARDSKRIGDINALADVLESNYDSSTQTYRSVSATYFSSGVVPTDPKTGDTNNSCNGPCVYCFKGTATASACSGTDVAVGDGTFPSPTDPTNPNRWFSVCADMEVAGSGQGGSDFYCRRNSQ